MRKYWMDTDSFITPYQGPYRFQTAPQFWDFIKQQAEQGIIGSPEMVLDKELTEPPPPRDKPKQRDRLAMWAAPLRGILFIRVDDNVQDCYREVAQYVQNSGKFKPYWIEKFLGGADAWVIAYAKAHTGKVVTLEVPQPQAKKPKVPDIAAYFHIQCITVWDMLEELGFNF